MTEEAVSVPKLPEPSAFYRWSVLLFLSLTMLGNYYFYDALEPLVDLLQSQLGLTGQQIGLLNSFYSISPICTVLIGGVIIDRIGSRKALLLFGSICMVGSIVTAMGGSFPVMAVGRLIFGMGAESLIVAVTTAVAKWFRGRELSFALGLNLMLARMGTYLAQRSPSWAHEAYSHWRTPWLIGVGFVSLCVICPVIYWLMDAAATRRFALGAEGEQDKVEFADIKGFGQSYWWLVGLCMVFYSAIFSFETFGVKYFMDAHGASLDEGGKLLSVITSFTMIGTPIVGLFADKLGRRATLMLLGSSLLIPVFLLLGYTHVTPYASMAMTGFAFTFVPAIIWPSVAYVVKPRALGTALGLMTMVQNSGMAFFNWALGKANDTAHAGADNPGGYLLMLQILTALGALGLFFAFMLRRAEAGPHAHGLETLRAGQQ